MLGGSLLIIALALWYTTSYNAELLDKENGEQNQVSHLYI